MSIFAVILTMENNDRDEELRSRLEDYRSIQVNSGFYLISSRTHTTQSLAKELGVSKPDGPYAIVSELQGEYYGFMPENIKGWLNA